MTNDLIPAAGPDRMRYAQALAEASILPAAYRRQPANVLLAMELGAALRIPPIQAITGIHVIDGKPTASADLIAALVRRAGHRLRVTGDDKTATATIIRADDPEFEYTATWTLDRASRAGLTGKGVWKTYPAAMLRARAITEVARAGAGEALYGVIYTPEELGHDGPPERPVEMPMVVEEVPAQDVAAAAVAAMVADESRARSAMWAAIKAAGIDSVDAREFVTQVVGRDVEDSHDLSADEVAAVTTEARSLTETGDA